MLLFTSWNSYLTSVNSRPKVLFFAKSTDEVEFNSSVERYALKCAPRSALKPLSILIELPATNVKEPLFSTTKGVELHGSIILFNVRQ